MSVESEYQTAPTVDPDEVARFDAMAADWWDPDGPMRPLHRLNPVRLGYIRSRLGRLYDLDARSLRPLTGLRVADLGCGAGLVSEPLARLGARVVAIDAAAENVAAARAHADTADLEIDYRHTTAEALAAEGQAFDAVVAMEVVEHVADLPAFLAAAAALVRPGGAAFFATINRTAKSFAEAIVAAEYLLRLLPRGTHRWDRFVKPSELRRHLSAAGVTLDELVGVGYRPLSGEWRLIDDPRVNYMAFGKKG